MSGVGTCFGFQVKSAIPFYYLRAGSGDPLEVACPSPKGVGQEARLVYEWLPRPGQPFHAKLYQEDIRYNLWIDGDEWFAIEPEVPRIRVPAAADPVLREESLWGIPAALCIVHRDHIAMHAAAVDVHGTALILGGPGHHGKTTLAAAFYEAGHRVLSDDLTCIRASSPATIIPGPAVLRVRPDTLAHLKLESALRVRVGKSRISLGLDKASRGNCSPVPVRAVVFLREAAEFKMERVKSTDAIPDLWALSFRVPNIRLLARCFDNIVGLAGGVQIWNVFRPLRFGELPQTVDRIIDRCLNG